MHRCSRANIATEHDCTSARSRVAAVWAHVSCVHAFGEHSDQPDVNYRLSE